MIPDNHKPWLQLLFILDQKQSIDYTDDMILRFKSQVHVFLKVLLLCEGDLLKDDLE